MNATSNSFFFQVFSKSNEKSNNLIISDTVSHASVSNEFNYSIQAKTAEKSVAIIAAINPMSNRCGYYKNVKTWKRANKVKFSLRSWFFARLLLQAYYCKSIIASLSFISFSVYISAKLAHHLGTNAKWLILQLSRFINIWTKSTDLKNEKACEIENKK